MKLFVVRHCSTICSEQKIFCGRTDVPLSPRGLDEAEGLRARFSALPELIISSPFLRARQTAEAISGGEIPVLFDERPCERDFGAFEGTNCDGVNGAIFRRNIALKYPDGESYLDVVARIVPFLGEVKERHAEKRVCLVSHGSACRVIRAFFLGMTDGEFYAFSQPNGSMEEYEL